jgi:WD40 repeat protein
MEDDERYAIASVSGDSGALHVWMRRDGGSRRTQTGCRPTGPSCVSSVVHRGHLFSASRNPSSTSTTISAHALWRVVGAPVSRCAAPEPTLTALALSPDASILATGAASGRCYIWSLASGALLASWDAHFRAVTRLAFTDDGETILSAGADASVLAFDVADLVDADRPPGNAVRPRASLKGHALPVSALCVGFGGASARVVTAAADRTARMWHLASASCIGTVSLSAPASDVAFTPDESLAFIGLESGYIIVAPPTRLSPAASVADAALPSLVAPTLQGSRRPAAVTTVAVSPHGAEVIAGYADGNIRVFDVASRMLLMTYSKHGDVSVSWVGVLSPAPDAVSQDAGGGMGAGGTAVVEGLLYEGSLRKAADEEFKEHFEPKLLLTGADQPTPAWAAVDCAFDRIAEATGASKM